MAFAFDPKRHAVLRAGGDKGGADQKRFYKRLIATADSRFDGYLAALKAAERGSKPKENSVARNLDQVIASLPAKRRAKIEQRASELATLKDLREA